MQKSKKRLFDTNDSITLTSKDDLKESLMLIASDEVATNIINIGLDALIEYISTLNNASEAVDKLNKDELQIVKARNLGCLKNIKPKYSYGQLVFLLNKKQTENNILIKYVSSYKDKLSKMFDSELFFRKLLTYYLNNPTQSIFLKYVFYYLDVLIGDTQNSSDLKTEYIETIKNIL